MSRTSTDLLDFFDRKGGRPAGTARAVSKPVGRERGDDVRLSKRQVALGVAVGVLAVALAFVGGIAVGRGRHAAPTVGAPLVNLAKETWILRGRPLPRIGAGAENLEQRLLAHFAMRYPDLVPWLGSAAVEEARGQVSKFQFRLVVRGFETEQSALAWAKTLAAERAGEYAPFQDARPERVAAR